MVAIPFPNPVPPPVMNAVLPLNDPGGSIGVVTAARLGCDLGLESSGC